MTSPEEAPREPLQAGPPPEPAPAAPPPPGGAGGAPAAIPNPLADAAPPSEEAAPTSKVKPWEDPERIKGIEPIVTTGMHFLLHIICDRTGRMPPTREQVQKRGLGDMAAQVLLEFSPNLTINSKWAKLAMLGLSGLALVSSQPKLAQAAAEPTAAQASPPAAAAAPPPAAPPTSRPEPPPPTPLRPVGATDIYGPSSEDDYEDAA